MPYTFSKSAELMLLYPPILRGSPRLKVYGINSYSQNNVQYVAVGSESMLQQVQVTSSGAFAGINNRTPAGLVNDPNNLWQLDVFNNSVRATDTVLIAHAAPNLADISSDTETDIWYGDITGTGALTATSMDPQSGGVVVLSPYLVTYGNGGGRGRRSPRQGTHHADLA